MIKSLKIKNYTLLEDVSVEFKDGFSVISGETGSGKSIMIDALALLLGKRVERFSREKLSSKIIIEGEFSVARSKSKFFDINNLDFQDFTIVRREININGKSRAFINDTPVLQSILLDFGNQIMEIHTQHQSILLKDKHMQFSLIDDLAKSDKFLVNFQQQFNKYNHLNKELSVMKESGSLKDSDIDFLVYQLEELEASNLQRGEKEAIEKQIRILENIEGISNVISISEEYFNNDQGVLSQLAEIRKKLLEFDSFKELHQRLDSVIIELDDISYNLSSIEQSLTSEPENLSKFNNRLDLINRLLHKHRKNSVAELIDLQHDLQRRINLSESFEEKILSKKDQISCQLLKLQDSVSILNKNRSNILPDLQNRVQSHLKKLGMPFAQFIVDFKETDTYHNFGNTSISFLFSANKGSSFQEISKVASGGELTRLMLAIKNISADKSALDVLVFDEIDTGVSGEVASLMGDMMKEISKSKQLLVISHLPQIASKADEHFKVQKSIFGNKTVSDIKRLNNEERIEEIAKLLSGNKLSKEAFDNARVLLNQ